MQPLSDAPLASSPLRRAFLRHLEEGRLTLPLLPEAASRVITMCGEDDCDSQRLAALIERDVSLAGHVLRISNSAAYAPNEPIVSLPQAVSRLGFSVICGIAVGVAVQGQMFRVRGYEEKLQELWHHCAASGAWAKEIARLRRRNVEGAFLCGLLHDVGRPVVLQALVALAQKQAQRPDDAELEALMEEFHTDVGARLVASWGMPDWMVAAVRHHHSFAAAGEFAEEAATAALGDLLAHWSLGTQELDEELLGRLPAVEALGLYTDELEPLFARSEAVAQLTEAFQ